jgi:hypothetical protein
MNRKLRRDRNAFLLLIAVTPLALLMALPITTQTAQNGFAGAGRTAPPRAPTFEQVDRNRNGFIEIPEAAALPGLAGQFEPADANQDGRLTKVEYAKALALMSGTP